MPAGVEVGTFVHRVLEAIDFAAPDLDAELAEAIAAVQARRPVELGDPAAVVAGLRAAIETPFLDGLRLRDLARADRLDELDFELPLVGGDRPTGRLDLDAVAGVLRAHGDPLGYADRLADPALRRSVRGYVTGSIDLVARVGDRFAVVDYKTNWLGGPGEELTACALPAGGARRRDGARRTTGCRRCSTRSPCTATCAGGCRATTPTGTWPASSTCSCAACGAGGVFAWRPPGRAGGGAQRRAGDRMSDPRLVLSAAGALREFNEAGVLAAADLHVARRLAELAGEEDEAVIARRRARRPRAAARSRLRRRRRRSATPSPSTPTSRST